MLFRGKKKKKKKRMHFPKQASSASDGSQTK